MFVFTKYMQLVPTRGVSSQYDLTAEESLGTGAKLRPAVLLDAGRYALQME